MRISLIHTTLLITSVIGIAAGQILFKLASQSLSPSKHWMDSLGSLAFNGYLIASIMLYMAITLLWVYLLRAVPLNAAYPFMGLTFLFVPALGAIVLGEPLTARILVGGLIILVGVYVSAS